MFRGLCLSQAELFYVYKPCVLTQPNELSALLRQSCTPIFFYTSSCETPLGTGPVPSYISLSTRELQTHQVRCTELSLRHLTPFLCLCCRCYSLGIDLPPSHPGGTAGERVVRSCAVHVGGIHQREARHRGEHPAGDRLHQQGLVRRRRGLGWVAHVLFDCTLCFLSFQQKLFDRHGAASVERHKDPSGW